MHASALLKQRNNLRQHVQIWVLKNTEVYLRHPNPFDTFTEVAFRPKDFNPLGNSVFVATLDVREVKPLIREQQNIILQSKTL